MLNFIEDRRDLTELEFKPSHMGCPKSLWLSSPSKPEEGWLPYSFSWFLLCLSSEYVKALAFPLVTLLRVSAWKVPYLGMSVYDFRFFLYTVPAVNRLLTNLQNKLIYQGFLIFVILKDWTNISKRSNPSSHAKYVYVQDQDFFMFKCGFGASSARYF